MKNILVAVDGSESSAAAARLAKELALSQGATLTVANVVEPVVMTGEVPWAFAGQMVEAMDRAAEEIVAQAKRDLATATLEVRTRVLRGDAGLALCEEADTHNYDMVVVGSRGRGAVQRVLLGSVADRVVHHAHVPVLVVRHNVQEKAKP